LQYALFGTINSGFGGRPYRYNYAATNEPGWFLFNGLVTAAGRRATPSRAGDRRA